MFKKQIDKALQSFKIEIKKEIETIKKDVLNSLSNVEVNLSKEELDKLESKITRVNKRIDKFEIQKDKIEDKVIKDASIVYITEETNEEGKITKTLNGSNNTSAPITK